MDKHQIKAVMDEAISSSFLLRNIQKLTDTIYETVPFAFSGSVRFTIFQCQIATAIARVFAAIAEEPALEMFAQHIELYNAWHRESLDVWRRTGNLDKVREFYAERTAERLGSILH